MARDVGIDLGTTNTVVYVRGQGIRLDQPTVIALDLQTGEIRAMGGDAYEMLGRTPGHIVAVRPLRGGAVSDFETATQLIRLLLDRVGARRAGRPSAVVCVPSTVTPVERRAVQQATVQAGTHAAYLLEKPMAAALGAGVPVHEACGHLIANIGGGTTQVACISLGGIVVSNAIRIGGMDLDAAIAVHVRREHGLTIGERTAERVKVAIGSAFPQPDDPRAEVRGREVATGLPGGVVLTAAEVRRAIEDSVTQIVATVRGTLADAPPELANDVVDHGIVLTGGGSLLRGLDARIAQETGVGVHRSEDPLRCAVRGAGMVVEHLDELRPLLIDTA